MLDIQRVEEPSSHDTWLTARVDDKPELGAYIPADLHHGAAPVSVFWRGVGQNAPVSPDFGHS